jgi:hypothetical protein
VKSPCERIPFIKLQTQSKLYSISSLQIAGERERNVIGCVVFIIHIIVVFHSLTFIESNLQRREYHFVNTFNIYSVQYVGSRRKLTFREG